MAALAAKSIMTESPEAQRDLAALKGEQGRSDTAIGAAQQKKASAAIAVEQASAGMGGITQEYLGSLKTTPEFHPREVTRDEMMGFAGMASVFAALGAIATRGGVTTALNAAGAAMKGYNEGNLQQARLDMEQFNTSMKSAVTHNQQMLERYKAIMEDRKLSLNQKIQQYTIAAHEYQDTVALAGLREGRLHQVLERDDKLRAGQNQMEQFQRQFEMQAKALDTRLEIEKLRDASRNGMAGQQGLSEQAVDMLAHEAIKDKSVLANLGRGVQGARDLRAVTNRMAEVLAANGGTGMAQRRAEFRADSNSLNKLTMSYDAITAFEQTAVRNGHQLVDLAAKVDSTGIPVFERWIRAGRKAVQGDPEVSQFAAQMQVYRTEAARILTNPNLTGQLTDSARREVEEFLSGHDSAQQIASVVALLERDFTNRKQTLVQQMDAIRDRMTQGYGAGTKPVAQPQTFSSEADAAAAGLQPGTRVIINGVPGTWH